jgi:nucleoside-diphosphate-sugar epimerase
MSRVLVTGSEGLIGGYLTRGLLARGYDVTGIDNFSKHGTTGRQDLRGYELLEADAADETVLDEALADCDHFIAGAAMIGGLSYLHGVPLDLLIANERLTIAACESAIRARKAGRLRKVTWISSSMVYESATSWPSAEGDELLIPPPPSAYGFQKLAVEYFARAAWTQHQLPYTIIRPFNVIGVRDYPPGGRADASRFTSHVVPDLIRKVLSGQDPLRILGDGRQIRCYTWAGDLARGIAMSLDHPRALNEDFNIARAEPVTVADLAQMIWLRIKGPDVPFRLAGDAAFAHDVQKRVPDTSKARDLLGFTASTPLGEMLDEVVPWCREAVADGRL